MLQTLLEKLQIKDEKNFLIQGLPSSIEKQFIKLTFAKNLTPLLKTRKIDFALIFAFNETQLNGIIVEILPALHSDGKLWIAYPKKTSKIATTLNRDCSWDCITTAGYESVRQIAVDHVWTAMRFKKRDKVPAVQKVHVDDNIIEMAVAETVVPNRVIQPPSDFIKELKHSKIASHFFEKLSFTNKKEYVSWISSAKKQETRSRRLEAAIDKLIAGKRNPSEK
jgi:Bacteriocin-protection, YdeI or OmpD-Associated